MAQELALRAKQTVDSSDHGSIISVHAVAAAGHIVVTGIVTIRENSALIIISIVHFELLKIDKILKFFKF